jgi:hypothetical protein
MAWKTPSLIVRSGLLNDPLDSAGTRKPWVITVKSITTMLINARVLALASWFSQQLFPLIAVESLP